ncbi:MAG: YcxB family protein [Acidobacteria bacterium]|nr:YcxB family protein [Acidobacteriota bacterium]
MPVQLEAADLRRANLWFTANQPSLKIFLLLFALSAIANFLLNQSFLMVVSILAAVAMLLTIPLAVYFNTKRVFSDLKDFQKRFDYVFSDSGLETNNEKSHSHTSWDGFLKAVESKHSFNLFFQRRFFIVVPKRSINSAADLNRIREILKKNFGDKAKIQTNG